MSLSRLQRPSCSFLTSLAITLLSVTHALAELPRCSQYNLLENWKASKPEIYNDIRAQADATENGQSIFWKIEKDGSPTSYLLGTVHVSDPRVTKLPQAASNAYQTVDSVVLELSEVVDPDLINAAMAKRADLMLAKAGHSTTDLIGSENATALDLVLKARGLSLEAVSALSPILVYTFVAMPACEFLRQSSGAAFLDKFLGQEALSDGKTLFGLETPTEQLEALASLPEDFIKHSLISAIAMGDKLDALTSTTVELYLSQDLGAIMPLMAAATEEFTDESNTQDAGYAAFEERLITQRNHNMAERAVQYLAKSPTLIAVGALHLPGSQGLVSRLRVKGYVVTPVPLNP